MTVGVEIMKKTVLFFKEDSLVFKWDSLVSILKKGIRLLGLLVAGY